MATTELRPIKRVHNKRRGEHACVESGFGHSVAAGIPTMIWPFNKGKSLEEDNDNKATGSRILGKDKYSKEDKEWHEQTLIRKSRHKELDQARNKLNEIIGELQRGDSKLTH